MQRACIKRGGMPAHHWSGGHRSFSRLSCDKTHGALGMPTGGSTHCISPFSLRVQHQNSTAGKIDSVVQHQSPCSPSSASRARTCSAPRRRGSGRAGQGRALLDWTGRAHRLPHPIRLCLYHRQRPLPLGTAAAYHPAALDDTARSVTHPSPLVALADPAFVYRRTPPPPTAPPIMPPSRSSLPGAWLTGTGSLGSRAHDANDAPG